MTLPERLIRALLPSLLLAVEACGSSEPRESPPVIPLRYGRYDLVTYDAKLLPDTLRVISGVSSTPGSTGSVSCPEILLGATLDVVADVTAPAFTRTSRIAYPCTGTLPRPADLPDSLTRVETGHVTVVGTGVALSFNGFGDSASTEIGEFGHLQGTDISIDRVLSLPPPGKIESLPNARVYRHE